MFTSRAEFRTLLRQDNADLRLTPMSHAIGLATEERLRKVQQKEQDVQSIKDILKSTAVEPEQINQFLTDHSSSTLHEKQKADKILLRPGIELPDMMDALPLLTEQLQSYDEETIEQAAIQVKYATYIDKEKELVQRMSQLENLEIPSSFDYKKIKALGNEAMEKLQRVKPRTLGQASRISGINPSDVQMLMVYMGR